MTLIVQQYLKRPIYQMGMGILILMMTGVGHTAPAATNIVFPQGSYCASYSGDFSRSKTYRLYLTKNQTFEVKVANIEDDIRIRDSKGVIHGEWVDDNTYQVLTRYKGNHFVTVRSPYGDQTVEFCAY